MSCQPKELSVNKGSGFLIYFWEQKVLFAGSFFLAMVLAAVFLYLYPLDRRLAKRIQVAVPEESGASSVVEVFINQLLSSGRLSALGRDPAVLKETGPGVREYVVKISFHHSGFANPSVLMALEKFADETLRRDYDRLVLASLLSGLVPETNTGSFISGENLLLKKRDLLARLEKVRARWGSTPGLNLNFNEIPKDDVLDFVSIDSHIGALRLGIARLEMELEGSRLFYLQQADLKPVLNYLKEEKGSLSQARLENEISKMSEASLRSRSLEISKTYFGLSNRYLSFPAEVEILPRGKLRMVVGMLLWSFLAAFSIIFIKEFYKRFRRWTASEKS